MQEREAILVAALLVGVLGDAAMQAAVRAGEPNLTRSLRSYFGLHGPWASLCIAGGMMALLALIYLYVLRAPAWSWLGWAAFAIGADLVWRHARLFPSLDDYYAAKGGNSITGHVQSAIWAILPAWAMLAVAQLL